MKYSSEVMGILVESDDFEHFVSDVVHIASADTIPGYYFSESIGKYIRIKDMHEVHAINAAKKLVRDGGNEELIIELIEHAFSERLEE